MQSKYPNQYSKALTDLLAASAENFSEISLIMDELLGHQTVNFQINEFENILAEEEQVVPDAKSVDEMLAFLKS